MATAGVRWMATPRATVGPAVLGAREAREECGLAAIFGHPQASALVQWMLLALQHRGQESAGIAATDRSGQVFLQRGMGLVTDALGPEAIDRLPGHAAIGHVRYSTTGASRPENAQPIVSRFRRRFLAIAHNGNLVNAGSLRDQLEAGGAIFQTTTDTEVVAHLAARHGGEWEAAVADALRRIRGAWALVFLDPEGVIAARDPLGIRPLSLGKLESSGGTTWAVASETCALDAVGATVLREVAPGEVLRIDRQGMRTVAHLAPPQAEPDGAPGGLCAFEAIYLARPDSVMFGHSVHALRKEMGRALARQSPEPGDLVTGVPDSSLSAAMGYAEELRLPFEMGLIRNRYIGRTFIQPQPAQRQLAVNAKLNAVRKVIEGRRVVLVDDSIVRGTTARHIVRLLRRAGAVEVHVRIASPPYRFPCYYGVDTAQPGELIAAGRSVEAIREAIEADSLAFLELDRLLHVLNRGVAPAAAEAGAAVAQAHGAACISCFTGRYPVPPERSAGKLAFEGEPGASGAAGANGASWAQVLSGALNGGHRP